METNLIQINCTPLTSEECTERITRIYHEQLLPLEPLCRRRGLACSLHGGMIHVCSPHESWYICVHVRTGRLMLLHRSTRRPQDVRTPHYHEQACRSENLILLLLYIIGHDALRAEDVGDAGRMVRKEKRLREKQARLLNRRRMARSLSRIERLDALDVTDTACVA